MRRFGALTDKQRQRYERQLAFVIEHRSKVPSLIKTATAQLRCSPSTLYNTINGSAFNTRAIAALYEIVCESLGFDKLIGDSVNERGRTIANEHDQKILEAFASAQELQSETDAARITATLAVRDYENSYVAAELAKSQLHTLYSLTGSRLSAETLTMISAFLAKPLPPYEAVPDTFAPLARRTLDEVRATPIPVPQTEEYAPLPIIDPEPGNTDADYLEYLRTHNPIAYIEELERRGMLDEPVTTPNGAA